MAADWRTIKLDRGDSGMRLDRVLLRHLQEEKGASRNRIQKWIEGGDVLINGVAPPRAAWRVQAGDDIRVRAAAIPRRTRPKAEALAIEVLYEDDELIAINKPPGLVVHPSFGNTSGTLLNGLLARAETWPPGSTPALLGRLDKFTSGLVLATKRSPIYAALQRAMAAHRIEKDYLAIVSGKPSPIRGTIDLALDRDPWDRKRVTVTDRGGQPSLTKYERLATCGTHSAVRCRLITGRTHQIRVHFAAKGWPIVGDSVYGGASSFPRQALHAWRLRFTHPRTGTEMSLEAPIPADMRALADALGLAL